MVIYWSMLLLVFFIGLSQPNKYNPLLSNRAQGSQATWKLAIALMLPVVFFASVRSAPIDTHMYIIMYDRAPMNMSVLAEWLEKAHTDSRMYYGVQMWFKNTFHATYVWWFTIVAVIQGGCIAWMLKKYSANISMSVYIYMASTMFTWMYNGARQFLAVAILFALSDCIIKNRWYVYLPVVVLLGGAAPFCEVFGWQDAPWYLDGVHQSALMMIPIFFFVQGKVFNWKMLVFVVAFVGLLFTGGLDSFLESATETTAYAADIHYMQEDTGAHPLRAVVPAVPLVLALLKKKEIEQDETVPKIITVSINMSIITVALYVASVFTSGIFVGRLPIYTEVYSLILLPWLIQHPYKKDQQTLTYGLYGAYLLWFMYQMHIAWSGLSYTSKTLGLYFWGGTV